ncbi:MAG: hypothetical protein F4017_08950 [Acidimicrobiaceae bacterium]|nr:hypothetical protein [Acidimicrobiaceae bacterium]
MADEDTPVEDAEDSEGAAGAGDGEDSEGAAGAAGAADGDADAPADGRSENAAASEVKPSARRAKAAALVAGTVLAGAAAIVGAVWAVTAIADDDHRHGDDVAVSYFAPYEEGAHYEESAVPERSRRDQFGRAPRADRDQRWRFGRDHRDRRDRPHRDRGEKHDRDTGKRTFRGAHEHENEHEDGDRQRRSEGSEPSRPAAEECLTIHRFGRGEDAVMILVCRPPGAEWPEFEPGEGGYFGFRGLPRDAFPFFGMGGHQWPFHGRQRPFGPGPVPWDRDGRPFEDGWPFRDGRPRDGGRPFDLEEFFRDERFGDGGLPFDLGELLEDGVPFDLGELLEDGVPFDLEELFEGEQLSDEEREQLEQMLEMLEGFDLGSFLDGLLDSLDGLEFEFPESQNDPAGASGA